MNIKISKKQRQFLINSFMICSFISFTIIVFGKLTLPNKSSQDIATTIGGVLGTAFSFFGSVLVYLALKAQVEANQLVQKQLFNQELDSKIEKQSDYFKNRISIIQHELNNFNYSYIDRSHPNLPKINYEGSQGIYKLLENSKDSYYGKIERTPYEIEPKLLELRSLLVFFELTVIEIRENEIIDNLNKINLLNVLNYTLNSKVVPSFDNLKEFKSKHNSACQHGCGNYHGIPSELFDFVDGIHSKINMKL